MPPPPPEEGRGNVYDDQFAERIRSINKGPVDAAPPRTGTWRTAWIVAVVAVMVVRLLIGLGSSSSPSPPRFRPAPGPIPDVQDPDVQRILDEIERRRQAQEKAKPGEPIELPPIRVPLGGKRSEPARPREPLLDEKDD